MAKKPTGVVGCAIGNYVSDVMPQGRRVPRRQPEPFPPKLHHVDPTTHTPLILPTLITSILVHTTKQITLKRQKSVVT